jgi:hypothetical protein
VFIGADIAIIARRTSDKLPEAEMRTALDEEMKRSGSTRRGYC